ncbi:MAG: hypothetical protein ACI4BB_01515 [Coprococcus sp.]
MIVIDTQNMHLTEADSASYDSVSQVLKAATAYVSPDAGKILAIIAKSIELQHMIDYLNSGSVSACSTGGRQIPPEEIIKDLRKYCGPKEKEQLDKCLNIMNMAKMYEIYKNLAGSADIASAASAFNNASSVMSHTQQSMSHAPAAANTSSSPSGADNDYLKYMQSLLTPEQLQLLNNISNQQHT